jgi:hypothetical protein
METVLDLGTDLIVSLDPVTLAALAGYRLDPWQREAVRSEADQQLILAPRQSGKTLVSAVRAAHELLANPGALVLLVAPATRQAGELYRTARQFLEAVPGVSLVQRSALSLELGTGSRLVVIPGDTADARTTRGFSAVRLLIIDEAARVRDDVYYSLRPVVAVSRGKILLLSTPAGQRGAFFKEATSGSPDWHRVRVSTAECPRLDPQWLAAERERIGRWWYAQEYGTPYPQFLDAETALYATADIEACISIDVRPLFLERGAA